MIPLRSRTLFGNDFWPHHFCCVLALLLSQPCASTQLCPLPHLGIAYIHIVDTHSSWLLHLVTKCSSHEIHSCATSLHNFYTSLYAYMMHIAVCINLTIITLIRRFLVRSPVKHFTSCPFSSLHHTSVIL